MTAMVGWDAIRCRMPLYLTLYTVPAFTKGKTQTPKGRTQSPINQLIAATRFLRKWSFYNPHASVAEIGR